MEILNSAIILFVFADNFNSSTVKKAGIPLFLLVRMFYSVGTLMAKKVELILLSS